MAAWRLRRLYHIETAFLSVRFEDLDLLVKGYKNLDLSGRLALVVKHDALGPHTLDKLCRYEARLERSFYKALHELQRLHAPAPR